MLDITALILADHEWFRRQFALLDDVDTAEDLAAIWTPLATRLDTHAEAEETFFYPALLELGQQDPEEETDDALHDHNKIRDAIADAATHKVGTKVWFEAVGRARTENSEHLAEEEDEGLADFRKHATFDKRAELGAAWLRFYAEHPAGRGISGRDVDVDAYLEENT